MKKVILFTSTLLLAACSSQGSREPSSLTDRETGPNQEVFKGGSREYEAIEFREMSEKIREVIQRQTTMRGQSPQQRGFHSKAHACLKGTLQLDPARPEWTRHGIFSNDAKDWKLWARFSNGTGWHDPDHLPDVRGLALKVLNVPGPKFMSDESGTQDFVMINNPTGFGSDAARFMRFAEFNARTKGVRRLTELTGYAVANPDTHGAIMRGVTTTPTLKSVADIQYWSGTPFRLGPDQAIKYSVRPAVCPYSSRNDDCDRKKDIPESASEADKLEAELACRVSYRPHYARKERGGSVVVPQGFCMELVVQPQNLVDHTETPIEDASKEWKTPFVRVGTIYFPNQEPAEARSLCERMVLNPWHAIEAHQPLGHQNRARRHVYEASAQHRQGGVSETSLNW